MALKVFYIIYFFLCLLVNFVFPSKFLVPFYLICGAVLFLSIRPSVIFKKLVELKNYSTIYLYSFLIWCLLTCVVSILKGDFSFSGFVSGVIGGLIFSAALPFLLTTIAFDKVFNKDLFLKILFIFFYSIFSFGIIQLIAWMLNIGFVNDIFQFINNRVELYSGIPVVPSTGGGVFRVKSIFSEPAFFASFITVTSPIVYAFYKMKDNIFVNLKLDLFLKKSCLFLMILNLLLTQAPIYIIFMFVVLLIIGISNLIKKPSKLSLAFLFVFIFSFISLGLFLNFNSEKNEASPIAPFKRIVIATKSFSSFDKFVQCESSLATRYLVYRANIEIWKKNLLCGVGYGNSLKPSYEMLNKLNLPLTKELIDKKSRLAKTLPTSFIYRLLAETGFIGVSLFFIFIISLYVSLKKCVNYYQGNQRIFAESLKYYLVFFVINIFYNLPLHTVFVWIFLAIIQAVIIYADSELKNC